MLSDPVAGTHHELTHEELFVLDLLEEHGPRTSLRLLGQRYDQTFAPQRAEPATLMAYLSRLHGAGLLVATGPHQADELFRLANEQQQTARKWGWTKLLATKLVRIPTAKLSRALDSLARTLLSPAGAGVAIVLATVATLLLVGSAERLAAELPTLRELASPRWWVGLLVIFAGLKTIHELGHALACRRWGVEVREMGLMLLLFAPCLYCDVTDAWRLASRWQRAAIALGGVAVELLVAALATILWWATEPGLVHTMALHTMLIASLGSLLINLNPLVRFDGYYLLADLTDTTNLWSRSRNASSELVTRWFVHSQGNTAEPREPTWILLYGLASRAFLFLLLVAFMGVLLLAAKHWNRQAVGWGLVAWIVASMLLPTVARAWQQLFGQPNALSKVRWQRAIQVTGLGLLLLIGLSYTPLPDRIKATAQLRPAESEMVVVTLAGRKLRSLPAGTWVEAGEPIAWLENPEVKRQLLQAKAAHKRAALEVRLLESQRTLQPQRAAELPAANAELANAATHLAELEREAERLVLRAPRAGLLLPPEEQRAANDPESLATWTGTPLDPTTEGAWLEVGTPIASIAQANHWEAELRVRDADAQRVAAGQTVRVAFAQLPGHVLQGEVIDIARRSEANDTHTPLLRDAWFLPEQAGLYQETTRRVRVAFPKHDQITEGSSDTELLIAGGRGEARIVAGWRSIGNWLAGIYSQTFGTLY